MNAPANAIHIERPRFTVGRINTGAPGSLVGNVFVDSWIGPNFP